jgi:hypothetical protein
MFIDLILLLWRQSLDGKLLRNHLQKQLNDAAAGSLPERKTRGMRALCPVASWHVPGAHPIFSRFYMV